MPWRRIKAACAIVGHEGEQTLIREFFGESPGYFVEVGANDPVAGSQSWHLEQSGWSGVLIEPQPELASRLRSERRARVFEAACSSHENAGTLAPLHVDGAYSSLDEKSPVIDRKLKGAILVRLRTLDEILTEAGAPTPVDFVSIDVEGHTVEVLKGATLSRWRPRLLLIEDHVTTLNVHRYMVSNGYRWFRRTGLNSWYVPSETAPAIGAVGRLQFFRKYYLGTPFRIARDALRRFRAYWR
jgi:FkbM family methyltransferase